MSAERMRRSRWDRAKDSAILRAGRRPLKGAEKLLRVSRALMTAATVAGTILAILAKEWLWLAVVAFLVAAWGWVAATFAERELKQHEALRMSFDLGWLKVAAEKTHDNNWFEDHPGAESFLVSFLVNNKGARLDLAVTLESRTVKGLVEEFPQGDRPLRWLSTTDPTLDVVEGAHPRVDVAFVAPAENAVRFLGPGLICWQQLTATEPHLSGRVRIAASDYSYQRIYNFDLSIGTKDPVGLDLFLVE